MKKILIIVALIFVMCIVSVAEERVYQETAIIHVAKDGKVSREKGGYRGTYEIGDKTVSASWLAIRDVGGIIKGESTKTYTFTILGTIETLPKFSTAGEEAIGIKPKEGQKVILAVRMADGLLGAYPENLMLGEDFFISYRPTTGFDSVSVFVGKRIK